MDKYIYSYDLNLAVSLPLGSHIAAASLVLYESSEDGTLPKQL